MRRRRKGRRERKKEGRKVRSKDRCKYGSKDGRKRWMKGKKEGIVVLLVLSCVTVKLGRPVDVCVRPSRDPRA